MTHPQALLEHATNIRQEHDYLLGELETLEAALARVNCYSEVYATFEGAGEACGVATRMLETVLRHFDHEERTILPALGRTYPTFVSEMQRQHDGIRRQLQRFTTDLLYLSQAEDPNEAIQNVKDEGEELARSMVAHMQAEERRYHLLAPKAAEADDWGAM
ncbi:MAG: hemerythrin domain-containing protein [Candidatus Koribacter versatilis]|uniref:Hemerythrin domain-containing protein n=1 Tax=Candidatus Korobacter versatilis TaxID=658062 RepID=A0A932A6H6_9BACT|nr:hemerythrin domain-containing protein [Candidatus Koribacter versatilis]